jgi:hypothetical protein
MYEQLRQEPADRDGMTTKEDKAQEKAADIERMKRKVDSHQVPDPRWFREGRNRRIVDEVIDFSGLFRGLPGGKRIT